MNIHIIYSTEVGTTKYVAEVIQNQLISAGHKADVYLIGTDGFQPKLDGYDMVLFGSPTYYNGQVPSSMNRYLGSFKGDLSKYRVGVFSLGDTMYPDFCASAKILEEWVSLHQGKVSIPTLKIDGFPSDLTPINEWAMALLATN